MKQSDWFKLFLVIIVFVIFGAYAVDAFLPQQTLENLPSFMPKKVINLGLDLKGGTHLTLEVETDKALAGILQQAADNLKKQFDSAKIAYNTVEVNGKKASIDVTLMDPNDSNRALDLIQSNFGNFETKTTPLGITMALKPKIALNMQKEAVSQAVGVIRNRIDQFGVAEPTVVTSGARDIVVELPGISDPERAIKLIGQTAVLELHLVDDSVNIENALNGQLPPDDELLYQVVKNPTTGEITKVPIVVKKVAVVTGSMIKKANVSFSSNTNQPVVSFELNSQGSSAFAQFTSAHIGKRLAIVLDNTVYSAPVIREPILNGSGEISGDFTVRQAHDLSIVLRSGSLPAPVKVLEKTVIGPTLGKDSIRSATLAIIIGSMAVFLFMVIYYKSFGLLADIALMFNLLIIIGTLAMLGATLTLPGIAGMALTVGMSVDTNVLIFERIREELFHGRTPKDAVELGYDRSLITIIDTHITTLITAFILYQFGSETIRGFAITLAIGLIANMFTAITFTKVVYDALFSNKSLKKLSI
jgi:preprotein translocase subunit SecD